MRNSNSASVSRFNMSKWPKIDLKIIFKFEIRIFHTFYTKKSLFGHYQIFDTLKNLYLNKKFPNKIILSGEKGIGKCTLAYHVINYILSLNEDHNYDMNYVD